MDSMKKINKYLIYFYFIYTFFMPVFIIYFGIVKNPELAHDVALYGGFRFPVFGNITFNTVLFSLLLINIFIGKRKKIDILIKRKYIKILYFYIFSIVVITILQYIFFNIDFILVLKKPIPYLLMPILLLNLLHFFDYKDIKKLFNFLINSLIFLLIFFVFFRVIPYILSFSGINVNYRLQGFLYHSMNGTASILSIILILFLYKYTIASSINKKLFFVSTAAIVLLLIVFTFTRTIFFALVVDLLLYLMLNKKMENKFIIILLLLSLLFFIDTEKLEMIFLRGQSFKVITDIYSGRQSTFAGRINSYWLPTINFALSGPESLLLGSKFRGFNDLLFYLIGKNQANHNVFIQHLATYGIVPTILYFLFWFNILKDIFSALIKDKQIEFRKTLMAIFFILVTYFISFNFMNIGTPLFENTIVIILFIYFKLQRNFHRVNNT